MNININEKNFFPNRIYTKNELIGIDGWRVLKTGKFQSRSYTVYSKEITHKEISWRLLRGIKALAATLFTFRLDFKLSPCAQKLWKQVKSGIETRKIKVQDELPDTNRNTNEIQQQSLAHLSFSKGGIQNGGNSCYISAALQYFNVVYFNSLSQNKEIAKGDESEEMFDLKKQAAQQTFAILEKLNRGVTITRHEVNALRKVLIKRINKDREIMNEKNPGHYHLIYNELCELFDLPYFYYNNLYHKNKGKIFKIKDFTIDFDIKTTLSNENEEYTFPQLEHLGNDHYRDYRDIRIKHSQDRPVKLVYRVYNWNEIPNKTITFPLSIILTNDQNLADIEPVYHFQGCVLNNTGHSYVYLKKQTVHGLQWIRYDDDKVIYNIPEQQVLEEVNLYGKSLIYSKLFPIV